jgi:hypothetical protein
MWLDRRGSVATEALQPASDQAEGAIGKIFNGWAENELSVEQGLTVCRSVERRAKRGEAGMLTLPPFARK